MEQTYDNVNHPKHYENGPECIEVMEAAFGDCMLLDYCVLNAFKYYWRHTRKNGLEDLRKMDWYLDKAQDILDKGDFDMGCDEIICIKQHIRSLEDIYHKVRAKYSEAEALGYTD